MTSRIGRLPSRILAQRAYFLQANTPHVVSGHPCPTLGLLVPPWDSVPQSSGSSTSLKGWAYSAFNSKLWTHPFRFGLLAVSTS